jgi:hypothetical protein
METTPRFRDRVKDTFKDREIKKVVVTHWQKHKEAYIVGALSIVGTALYMNKGPEFHHGNKALNLFSKNQQTSINTTTNFNAPTRLSYIVKDTNGNWYDTQSAAANALGVTPRSISMHLNHGIPLPTGDSLERVGVRS